MPTRGFLIDIIKAVCLVAALSAATGYCQSGKETTLETDKTLIKDTPIMITDPGSGVLNYRFMPTLTDGAITWTHGPDASAMTHLNIIGGNGYSDCNRCHQDQPATTYLNNNHRIVLRTAIRSLVSNDNVAALGIRFSELGDLTRSQLNLDDGAGVAVNSVCPSLPIGAAGVEAHDVVLSVDDDSAKSPKELAKTLSDKLKSKVVLTVLRGGKRQTIEVELKDPVANEDSDESDTESSDESTESTYLIGVTITNANETLRQQLNLAEGQGAAVGEVYPDMPAHEAGLQKHDMILTINGTPVKGIEDVRGVVRGSEGKPLTIEYVRAGERATVEVTPTQKTIPRVTTETGNAPPHEFRIRTHNGVTFPLQLHWQRAQPGGLFLRNYSATPVAPAEPRSDRRIDDILKQLDDLTKAVQSLREAEPDAAGDAGEEPAKPEE